MSLDRFWELIDAQIERLRTAKTADDVLRICPSAGTGGDGFFGGGGGDVLPQEPLSDAGWRIIWQEASYHWAMQAPNGDAITYVEGDIYRGDSRGGKARTECNAMFCVLETHEGDEHQDATYHRWSEPTPDRPVIAHVYELRRPWA